MLRWALTGTEENKNKVTSTGNAAHDLDLYETGKETVVGKLDRINNVYDLEGNGREWTAEASLTGYRLLRGGSHNEKYEPNHRDVKTPTSTVGSSQSTGQPKKYHEYTSRVVLYIK